MALVQVTAQNFEATIERGIVLLDWWAAWCGPCRMFAPIFEAASARHPDVVFGKVGRATTATDTGPSRWIGAPWRLPREAIRVSPSPR